MAPHHFSLACTAVIAAASVASCGGKSANSPPATTTVAATNPDTAPSVLASPAETVSFSQVERAIARLYRRRPGIGTFVVRDVEYTPATRNKVLDICHRGGCKEALLVRG